MLESTWAFDWGMATADDIDTLATALLIRRLYGELRECTGGPLHAILDDGNIYDDTIHHTLCDPDRYAYLWDGSYGRWAQAGDDVSAEHRTAIQDTCEAILRAFDEMTESRRAAACAWAFGHVETRLPELAARVLEPEVRRFLDACVADRLDAVRGEPIKVLGGATASKPCGPIPCPPFTEVTLKEMAPTPWSDFIRDNIPLIREATPEEMATFSVAGTLADPRQVRPRWSGDNRPRAIWQPWLNTELPAGVNEHGLTDRASGDHVPLYVGIPADVEAFRAAEAIQLCQRLGLLPETPGGLLLLPEEMDPDPLGEG